MPINRKTLDERERDILDSYSLQEITRNEAAQLLRELYRDHWDALTSLSLTDECNERNSK